jgi:hypothetical protein
VCGRIQAPFSTPAAPAARRRRHRATRGLDGEAGSWARSTSQRGSPLTLFTAELYRVLAANDCLTACAGHWMPFDIRPYSSRELGYLARKASASNQPDGPLP